LVRQASKPKASRRDFSCAHEGPISESGRLLVGIDVGSTTVKTVVRSADTGETLLHNYRRHESRQAETVLYALQQAKGELSIADSKMRLLMTGSDGQKLAELLGARFVQEVAAVSLAVETAYPEVRFVIELGGQDAKMIVFQESGLQGNRKKIASMNDKCAGGTGVVIEKIAAKLHIPQQEMLTQRYDDVQVYPVAGKCGVFAETDITGLQKQGVPPAQLMASLFQAIILQNLSVLTRGHTLLPTVFLLGGPMPISLACRRLGAGACSIFGRGRTGYSKGLLKKVLSADVALVETVAHAKASLRLDPDVEAIIDVGGQDIKIILHRGGAVKDFKLNTQCSAGNGYFLRAAAEGLGIRIEDFADVAFRARRIPQFSYGCAIFLQSDIVNFQHQGRKPEEILAGLATVLPKNVFQYVAGVSNVATLGSRFVLQGGTQRNLAVVKAEVDFIREHYHGNGQPGTLLSSSCGVFLEADREPRRTRSPDPEVADRTTSPLGRDSPSRDRTEAGGRPISYPSADLSRGDSGGACPRRAVRGERWIRSFYFGDESSLRVGRC
jgi:activator of 2-hydroxyglutaryl-CoA dehydratase